jgi:hypothetical protein
MPEQDDEDRDQEYCLKCGSHLDNMGLCDNSECEYYGYKDFEKLWIKTTEETK